MRRGPAAQKAGLRTGFAFPILVGDGFYGVLEFFGREVRQPDRALIEVLHTIGSQVGQFMARKAAEQNLRFVASHDPVAGIFLREEQERRGPSGTCEAAATDLCYDLASGLVRSAFLVCAPGGIREACLRALAVG